jgi:hypothetical protein
MSPYKQSRQENQHSSLLREVLQFFYLPLLGAAGSLGTFFTFSYFAGKVHLTMIVGLHAKTITIRYAGGRCIILLPGGTKDDKSLRTKGIAKNF